MSERWEALLPGAYGISAEVPGADPMWVWADATGYREHRLRATGGVSVVIDRGSRYERGRFVGRDITVEQYRGLNQTGTRLELSLPVIPLRPRPTLLRAADPDRDAPMSDAAVLVAAIDSGCPFAARMLRDDAGSGTRILALWDQDPNPSFGGCGGCGGYRPNGLGYGCVLGRDELNGLMQRATRGGAVEEERCYRLAGYPVVRSWASHGAAVLSQLLARPVYGGALQPAPGKPPSWDPTGPLPIDRADVVFVQLPRDAVQDSTSAGLARSVVDGLRFVLGRATRGVTRRIVVTLSNGTSRTAHDGTSILEQAILSWIDEAALEGFEASVVIPIGNTNEEQRHGVLSESGHALDLLVPPDGEMPQYVTVRWPAACASEVALRVTPPSGAPSLVTCGRAQGWPSASLPQCGVIWPKAAEGATSHALIVVAPTAPGPMGTPVARSGRWRIEIASTTGKPLSLAEPALFWISRNQTNPGAALRARQAYFVDSDEQHEPRRYLRRSPDLDDSRLRNGVRRYGALSGLATLSHPDGRVQVVGGYVLGNAKAAPSEYSASGPAAGSAAARRQGPDLSMPSDSNPALRGLTVRANLSGAVVRMVGTSFAAPSAARAMVNGALGYTKAAPMPQPLRAGRRLRP